MNAFEDFLQDVLQGLADQGLRRNLRVIEAIHGTRITIGGRELQNFSSNDYLGLASHPALAAAMAEAAARYGVGATASG